MRIGFELQNLLKKSKELKIKFISVLIAMNGHRKNGFGFSNQKKTLNLLHEKRTIKYSA